MSPLSSGPLPALPFFNVRDFGAVGNGVVDDTNAVQATINAASAAGGIANFPAGTYLVSATITIGNSGVALVGAGQANELTNDAATTIKFAGGVNADMFKAADTTVIRTLYLWNLALDGNKAGNTSGSCVDYAHLDIGSHAGMGLFNVTLQNFAGNGLY